MHPLLTSLKKSPLLRRIWRAFFKRPSEAVLRVSLDSDLSKPFLVGDGTLLSLYGWCYHPETRIERMQILLAGKAFPVLSHSRLRKEVLRDQVPRLDTLGNSLNSGFEALIPVASIRQPMTAELRVRVRLANQRVLEAPLGAVDLLPSLTVDQPEPVPAGSRLALCMTTYNPQLDLLEDQIDSIRKQTFEDWICIVNDDCSEPETYEAIRRIAARDRRFIVYRNASRLGFYHNFETCLMRVPPAVEFVGLADQDDHWYPDKLESTLEAFAPDVHLVYCDQHIVTRDGKMISPTYWSTRRNNYTDLAALIFANTVTGAASVFRRSLLAHALPFPPRFWDLYHDGWLACVALASGRIAYVDRPLYAYRQHPNNVIGHATAASIPLPTAADLIELIRQPGRVRRRFMEDSLRNYNDYRTTALLWTFIARFLLLRVPHSHQRRLLRMLSALDHSLPAWAYQVLCAAFRKRSTFGYEWRGLRNTFGKQLIDRYFQRHQSEYVEQYLEALSRDRDGGAAGRLLEPGDSAADGSLDLLKAIQDIIAPLLLEVRPTVRQRINIVLSTIDFRYIFGGYIAMFNLALQLVKAGYAVRVVLVQATDFRPDEWRREFPKYPGLADFMDRVEIACHSDRTVPLVVHPKDRFIATSWWTAHIVQQALAGLQREGFLFFVQEYEPLFHPGGSLHALAREAYTFPQHQLFSTELLRDYFKQHSYGVFSAGVEAGEKKSVAFQNAIPRDPTPPEQLRRSADQKRKLLFYARPEAHAQRNMFELGIMAISTALERGVLDLADWEVHGIGSLGGAKALTLANGGRITLLPKLSFEDYRRHLKGYDIGVSLMLTPHPSLVPLDMAASGLLTITNTFENKTAEKLTAISSNLIPVLPTLGGIVEGIGAAVDRLDDHQGRSAAANLRWASTWDEALGGPVMESIQRFIAAMDTMT